MAGLNLLAAIVIYWNTAHLGEAIRQRQHAGLTVQPELLAHISPLGWGPHPAHRRIPVAEAPIAHLAYDSAPYQSRPAYLRVNVSQRFKSAGPTPGTYS